MNSVHQNFFIHGYEVYVGHIAEQLPIWLSETAYQKVMVLVDENTKKYCLPILPLSENYTLIEIESGEKHKTIDTCKTVWEDMLAAKADRNSLLLNLGGGVISDLGGFCAATFKRGIDWVNIPTTLLAQVDATVGGKLGVDFMGQKNMVGLFKDPKAIFIDELFFKTLPKRQLNSGKFEMLKHGLIANEAHFFELAQTESLDNKQVLASLRIKKEFVEKDPFEHGIRKALNFGHTFGHAFEAISLKSNKLLLHGEAVGWGMIAELFLSMRKIDFPSDKGMKAIEFIKKDLPTFTFTPKDTETLYAFMQNDKKNNNSEINSCLLRDFGDVALNTAIAEQDIKEALTFCSSL